MLHAAQHRPARAPAKRASTTRARPPGPHVAPARAPGPHVAPARAPRSSAPRKRRACRGYAARSRVRCTPRAAGYGGAHILQRDVI